MMVNTRKIEVASPFSFFGVIEGRLKSNWDFSLLTLFPNKNNSFFTILVRRCMQAKPEFRKSERFSQDYIIKFGEDLSLSPYYAVSCNLSETGMYFKSVFELNPGAHLLIRIDDYISVQNQISAKVVWCKKIENSNSFRYGVGVEFLKSEKIFSLKAAPPIPPQIKTPDKNTSGVVTKMEKRFPK
jgi:hypothetical protein